MTSTIAAPGRDVLSTNEIRVEGRDKVSGKQQYTADIRRPDMLWAAFTTSPLAHARIISIDATAAKAVPGVKAVITSADVGPGVRSGRMLYDLPVLAYEAVLYIGDRVAAVAAETKEAAEEAARLVDVEYEELPALLDPFAALAPDAPILHPDLASYFYAGGKPPVRKHPTSRVRPLPVRVRKTSSRSSRARIAFTSTNSKRPVSTPATSNRMPRSCGSRATSCTSTP